MHRDVIIIGAGGAGLMCAISAGKRQRSVLLLDHAEKLGNKILISGGGRCNFTNTGASAGQYVSQNPHFCKSALARYPAEAFIRMVRDHGIAFHEKKLGQLFCDDSARDILDMLKSECDQAGAEIRLGCRINGVARGAAAGFAIDTSDGIFTCNSLVIATGGLSIPKIGATGFGHQIARQFGLAIVATSPALDGFTFADAQMRSFRELAGVSVDCIITCNNVSFRENLLFTHAGLSGPAALQASLYWHPGDTVTINLLPALDSYAWLTARKRAGSRTAVHNLLGEHLPARLADRLCSLYLPAHVTLSQLTEKAIEAFCRELHAWQLAPSGTVGYRKAEVTRGGVDTTELSSKTMAANKVPGLYFIGEVMDVTGWLGGYNFQWAWASGWAAGQSV